MKNIGIEEQLSNFIKQFSDDLCSLELLIFFSRHPQARFNRAAVLHAIRNKPFDTATSLKKLVDKKMVVTYVENGLTLYALTKEEPAYGLASQLINIDQGKWHTIVEYILDAHEIK